VGIDEGVVMGGGFGAALLPWRDQDSVSIRPLTMGTLTNPARSERAAPMSPRSAGYADPRIRKEVRIVKRNYTRLTTPLVRDNGILSPTSFEVAFDRIAAGLGKHPGDAFGMFSCSKATNETNYVAQKFARVVMGSNNIDSCNRT
jgi:anaerobic selenocysteine-containing dehydrogenase